MLEWKIVTRDEKLKQTIDVMKKTFNSWFEKCWSGKISKEKMLSEESPLLHVFYKMTKPIEEVKILLPHEGMEVCSSCEQEVDSWIEAGFSFCDKYECGIHLCKNCAKALRDKINEFLEVQNDKT